MAMAATSSSNRSVYAATALVLVTVASLFGPEGLRQFPQSLILPFSSVTDTWLNWFAKDAGLFGITVQQVTRALATTVEYPIRWTTILLSEGIMGGRGLNRVQVVPPFSWLAICGAVGLVAYKLGGRRLTITVGICLAYLVIFGLWNNAMVTMASVIPCVIVAAVAGLALGIWSFRSDKADNFVRALMNVMQTVPIFAYLLPTLLLFGYGPAAALIATVAYALPPMVHNVVIALHSVPSQTVEGGIMSGCTRRQLLWQVQLPAALPQLAVGLNQVVLMTLNMVIIASMIGAGGLGYDVLIALKKLDIGTGLEAGMAIVALAVALDRMGQAAARRAAGGHMSAGRLNLLYAIPIWLVLATVIALLVPAAQNWPKALQLTTAPLWNGLMTWINTVAFDTLDGIRSWLLLNIMRPFRDALAAIPWSVSFAAVGALGFVLGGWRLTLQVILYLSFVLLAGFWAPAMNSLYLLTISILLALVIGFPLGLWVGLHPKLHAAFNLLNDTLQTIPTLVYLLPAIILFRIGDVSAIIAISSYAFAAAVRYAIVAMTLVSPTLVEAARMSGSTRWQTFRWVMLPSSLPTLIVGVNQTIMMGFSMLVIAALVGTRDLGQEVLVALNQSKIGVGIIAGLSVAALALTFDALLTAAAHRRESIGKRSSR